MVRFTVLLLCASCTAISAGASDFVSRAGSGHWLPIPKANIARIETNAPNSISKNAQSSDIMRADDGLFYVTGDVDGTPVRFVIDTGATVVVLTPSDARRLGITPKPGDRRAHIQTVAGSSSMHWTKISRIKVAGQSAYHLDAAVVRGGLKVSLLGQNFLSEIGSMTLKKDRMSFHQHASKGPDGV